MGGNPEKILRVSSLDLGEGYEDNKMGQERAIQRDTTVFDVAGAAAPPSHQGARTSRGRTLQAAPLC